MVLPPVSTGLSASVEQLYDVFSKYRRPARSHGSPFSGITEQDMARLYSKPLRDLAAENLSMYARHAMTTWGDVAEYKHYLPRLYELLVVRPGWTDTGLLVGQLATAEWSRWSDTERDAVIAFLHELWAWSLTIDPDIASCSAILRGFGHAGIDPARKVADEADAPLQPAAISVWRWYRYLDSARTGRLCGSHRERC